MSAPKRSLTSWGSEAEPSFAIVIVNMKVDEVAAGKAQAQKAIRKLQKEFRREACNKTEKQKCSQESDASPASYDVFSSKKDLAEVEKLAKNPDGWFASR